MSRTDRSPPEVRQRRFAPLLAVRHSRLSQFCAWCSLLAVEACLSLSLGDCLNSPFAASFFFLARIALTRFVCLNKKDDHHTRKKNLDTVGEVPEVC